MAGGTLIRSNSAKNYPGKFTFTVFITCLTAAFGGVIFGYDIGISGGVTSMDLFLKKFFLKVYNMKHRPVKTTNQYCQYNSQTLTMFTSALYLAAFLSSLVASTITRRFSLKLSMLFGGLLFLLGALMGGFAQYLWMLIVGRILLGFGIGFASQAVPLYLSEIAPCKYRGATNAGFQLSITIGLFFANLLNYIFAKLIRGGMAWRFSLWCAMIPALVLTIGSIFLLETPSTMIERGDHHGAKSQLKKIRGVIDVDEEFNDLVTAIEASRRVQHPWKNLLQRKYRPQLTMAVLLPFFQQFTGINVIMFYAPVLFSTIGFKDDASLLSTVITGGVGVAATCVSIYGVDKWGRRALFIGGGVQMFICQVVVAIAIGLKFGTDGNPGDIPKWYAAIVVLFICIYVAGFSCSWGPLAWLVPSEIFPLDIRSAAQSVTVSVNMLSTFLVAQVFLSMLCSMKFGLFIFFAFFVVTMTLFIFYMLPETKGIPTEEIDRVWKSHPFWSKFVVHDDHTGATNAE